MHSKGSGIVVVGSDHSLALINQPGNAKFVALAFLRFTYRPISVGKIIWSRQEALASILSVEMLDLPLSEAQANIEEEFSTNGMIMDLDECPEVKASSFRDDTDYVYPSSHDSSHSTSTRTFECGE